jgi:hypothetical protein
VRRQRASFFLCAAGAFAVAIAGCGEGGASSGATVSVYVAAPLCREAQQQLRREAKRVEDLHVRAVCLPSTERGGSADLAQAGANARQATEDSTTVAYLEAPGPAAKFSQPILESADIAWNTSSSGAQAMRQVLKALATGDQSSPRETVRESLNG